MTHAYAASKLSWIRDQQARLRQQARETPRQFVERESHYLWGRRYLLSIREERAKPSVQLGHRRITLTIRPGSDTAKRAAVMHAWHKSLLHEAVPPVIRHWEPKLGVRVNGWFLQRMKTKWGGCNPRKGHIRLNTELVKKPRDLLEYVVVARNAPPDRTHSQRKVLELGRYALSCLERSQSRAERTTISCRKVEAWPLKQSI